MESWIGEVFWLLGVQGNSELVHYYLSSTQPILKTRVLRDHSVEITSHQLYKYAMVFLFPRMLLTSYVLNICPFNDLPCQIIERIRTGALVLETGDYH